MRTWMPGAVSALSVLGLLACGEASSTAGGGTASDTTESGVAITGSALKVVEADQDAGKLVLSYEARGRSVRYDLRVGGPMQQPPSASDLAAYPELPTYEVDARVVDAAGQAFIMQMATDRFMDPSWTVDAVENIDEAGRVSDMQLVQEAVAALRKLQLPGTLEQARLSAVQLGLGLRNGDHKEIDSSEIVSDDLGQGALGLQSTVRVQGPSSAAYWDFIIKKTPATQVTGDHSNVDLRAWSSNKLVILAHYYSCNHGSCADAGHMKEHCTMPGFKTDDGTHRRYFFSETNKDTCEFGDRCVTGGCLTGYEYSSSCRYHNCNDDTETQARAIWTNQAQNQRGDTCSGCALHLRAPACSY